MRTKYRSDVTIIVRPSVRDRLFPITAYIAGTQLEGQGPTVVEALEDLFTSREAGAVARELEREVEENAASRQPCVSVEDPTP